MGSDEPTAEELRDLTLIKAGELCQLDDVFKDLKEAALEGYFSCIVRPVHSHERRRLEKLGFMVQSECVTGRLTISWELENA